MDHDFGGTFPFEARFTPERRLRAPLRGRGTPGRRAAPVRPRQPDLELHVAPPAGRPGRAGPSLHRLRPHGLRALEQAAAAVGLLARAPRGERRGADRRARPARRDARGPRLGRPDRARRAARAPRAPQAPGAHEHLGLGAAQLPAALPARVPHRGAGRDPGAGRQPVRGVDPRRDGPPPGRPADDGGLPGAVPRLLVARRHARLPARHPAHRARPQRRADVLDPRPPGRARRAGAARVGHARPGLPAGLPRPVARAVPARADGARSTTPRTTWWRTVPKR